MAEAINEERTLQRIGAPTQTGRTIAVAHKDYAVRGGGERLAEELARTFNAELYVGGTQQEDGLVYPHTRRVDATPMQRRAIDRGGTLRTLAYAVAWSNETRLADYDVVITSGNEPLWYTPTSDQVLVAYCHSPPRELYDLNHGTGVGSLGALYRAAKRAMYLPNTRKPDLWVANGEEVARRINLYWDVPYDKIRVVYPPVDMDEYHPRRADDQYAADTSGDGGYYLYLGRLAHHKRVELAVEACNRLNAPLKVAGRGPQRGRLERLAGDTVDVLGYVGEQAKRELLAKADAVLMPAENEDFGMVPVEALASGTPVIGVEEGMTKHQVVHGKNGLLVHADADSFVAALEQLETAGVEWGADEIREWAVENFGAEKFRAGMRECVEEAVGRALVEPRLGDAVTVEVSR